jgi:ATP-dependent helicase/nuclease subunit A
MYNEQQIQASDPRHSVWLLSSAGAGKTKVLTDRVLRLLVQNVAPEKILCLTFTNAGACEMLTRIYAVISLWVTLDIADLKVELKKILGREASEQEALDAKNLFDNLFRTKALKIYTIHAFCQKILKKFPLEAGINPYFNIINELQLSALAQRLKDSLLTRSLTLSGVNIDHLHEYTLGELVLDVLSDSTKFQTLFDAVSSGVEYEEFLFGYLNVQYRSEIELFKAKIAQIRPYSKPDDHVAVRALNNYLLQDIYEQITSFVDIAQFFLTKDGQIKKRLLDKKTRESNEDLSLFLLNAQSIIYEINAELENLQGISHSVNIFNIAQELLQDYSAYKALHNYVDYNDLIFYGSKLLNNSLYKDWVLYKLDSQIEHLLIDEAQDTSREQWQIINAIIGDFFTGNSAKEINRTIFVVGDEKQSIYSFQGANLDHFIATRQLMYAQLKAAQKKAVDLEMLTSYRSGPAINYLVHEFLLQLRADKLLAIEATKLDVAKNTYPCRVEFWPLVQSEDSKDCFWPYYSSPAEEHDAGDLMAQKIAYYIKELLDSKIILPSTGKAVKASDIMILLRSRNNFIHSLTKHCYDLAINISGLDRLLLKEVLSVMDVVAVARFVLQPYDELNLAALLKSPFICITEQELATIIANQQEANLGLWEYLQLNASCYFHAVEKLQEFQTLYYSVMPEEFFYCILEVMCYKGILVEANGKNDLDALNEFLYLASDYFNSVSNSIANFLAWLDTNEIEIKRNVDNNIDEVKILTIHGSKGLESPIIIMPDTVKMPLHKYNYFWTQDNAVLWNWASSSGINSKKDLKRSKDSEEYWRLLYVALTRAQDYLVVGGYSDSANCPDNSWYSYLKNIMLRIHNNTLSDGTLIYQEGKFSYDADLTADDASGVDKYKSMNSRFNMKNI